MSVATKLRVDKALLSEDALALRFSEQHKHSLRYVALKNQWLSWDGTRWRPEGTLLAFDLARSSVREFVDACGADGRYKQSKVVASVERLARVDRRQAAELADFDADPMVFNCVNGTIDLATGELRKHNPEDFITRRASCEIAEQGAEHPLWSAFLHRVFDGNDNLIRYMQRWFGYCLTGNVVEHAFVFGHGSGGNGKGTMLNTIAWIFNDYATVADMGTFIASKSERHPTDIAKLHGARLVTAQETQQGRQWEEAKIKAMTGGDRLTGRFMRQDFFDFDPAFKLFVAGNHMPTIENVDQAMRRRFNLVPFTVEIGPEECDPLLPEKLRGEAPAILRWMAEGCLAWQREGLSPPAIVTEATDAYFDEQDLPAQWFEECLRRSVPTAFISLADLFSSWKNWCQARGIMSYGNSKELAERLTTRGFRSVKRNSGKGFMGLELKQGDAG